MSRVNVYFLKVWTYFASSFASKILSFVYVYALLFIALFYVYAVKVLSVGYKNFRRDDKKCSRFRKISHFACANKANRRFFSCRSRFVLFCTS